MSAGRPPGTEGRGQEASRDQFSEGLDRLRETAKWLVIAFIAIGAILVAGILFSNIGQFRLGEWRLWVAVVAATIAFAAIGGAVWFAIRTLIGGRAFIDDLVEEEEAHEGADDDQESQDIEFVNSHPQLLASFSTVKELRDEYNATLTEREEATKNDEGRDLEHLNSRLMYLEGVINDLILALRYEKVYRILRRASVAMLLLGLGAVIASLTFAWAANPPADPATNLGGAEGTVIQSSSLEKTTFVAKEETP